MRNKKFLLVIPLLLIAVVLLVFSLNKNETIDTNNEQSRSLVLQREDLEYDIKRLDEEYDVKINGIAHNMIIFSSITNASYNEIADIMNDADYLGVLVLSEDKFPDNGDYITKTQFNTLVGKGWGIAVEFINEKEFKRNVELLKVNELEAKTVYFEKDCYDEKYDQMLIDEGFEIVVHHGETDIDLYNDDCDSGIWHVGCVGVYGESPRFKLIDSVDAKGNFALVLGFEHNDETYSRQVLESVIQTQESYEKNNELTITTFEMAYEDYLEVKKGKAEMEKDYKEKKADLEAKLDEINEKIAEFEKNKGNEG